nr:endo-1,4-beta-xylanase [uncultured bacterium]
MEYQRRSILQHFEEQRGLVKSRLDANIEAVRKGFCSLRLTDSDGNPITDAHIRVVQKGHAFRYGANIFMLEQMETPEKNAAYKALFKDTFNMATVPFYWNGLEPERGKPRYAADSPFFYRRPAPDLCLDFCEANGIEPREHGLAYERFFPAWMSSLSVRECKFELERRYAEIAERYARRINTIEVTNEMRWAPGKEITPLYNEPDYVEFCFKLAEKYFPHNQLVINEASRTWSNETPNQRDYLLQIKNAIACGARIDAIGIQAHSFSRSYREREEMFDVRYNPIEMYRVMDTYAQVGLPIQITEVTIPAFSNLPEDEEIQADILENMYRLWFSHPNVEQIIYWNLVDGYAHRAEPGDMTAGENYHRGGLIRFDMTPKPAYYRVKDLFEKEWHTECDALHAYDGNYQFKGFLGDYDAEIVYDGKAVTVPFKVEKALGGMCIKEVIL